MIYVRISDRACATVVDGGSVTGSTVTPFKLRSSFSTSHARCSADRFLWMMPIPALCASAIASAPEGPPVMVQFTQP